jgi:MFS transporter, PAT family, beta-lactamase induction signal transducer AmpG
VFARSDLPVQGGARAAHPVVFLLLNVPFGALGGYITVTIGYLLGQSGVNAADIAELVAVSVLPNTWKFAWAPLVDTTLTRKAWYVLGTLFTAVGIAAMGIVPAIASELALLTSIVFVVSLVNTMVSIAADGLLAYATDEAGKGRAGGWYQAGNLGGLGIGGGAALWLTQVLPDPWMAGAILGAACALCCLALLFIGEGETSNRAAGIWRNLVEVGRDMWSVARSKRGFLGLLICFLPIGSGAASNLWAGIADDWHAGADAVALATGIASGIVSAVGCVIGGYFSDRIDRKLSYAIYGVLQALCAVAMALAPRTESMYVVFTLAYAMITGLTYAGFTAVVLEAIGRGAAATKYNVFASLSNIPIAYVTVVDGWAHTRWNEAAMLYTEAAIGVAALLFFAAVAAAPRLRRRTAQ